MNIRKGDTVKILSGKDKGKTGKVTQILPKDYQVVVEGANKMKRHLKSTKQGEKGQIVEFDAPLHLSNVKLVSPKSGKPTRVKMKFEGESKVRMDTHNEPID